MSRSRRNDSPDSLPPRVLQIVGLCGVVGQAVFWAVTNRIEPTLLAAFGGMVGVGQTLEALTRSRQAPPPPPPAPLLEPPPVGRLPEKAPRVADDDETPEIDSR